MNQRIDGRVEIGHVHLTVSDLERSLAFYSGVLGFDAMPGDGGKTTFLTADGSHHHIVLRTRSGPAGSAEAPETDGPLRFALRFPDRRSLGDALRRIRDARISIERSTDRGVTEALYLHDPDGHEIELYRVRPREEWPLAADGSVRVASQPLDLEALAREAGMPQEPAQVPSEAPGLSDATRRRLADVRNELLNLHKVLLDDTKAAYEMDRGRVGTNANLLQLVINDPWFAWLHSLSGLIVRIDETLRKDAPASESDAGVLLGEIERLLTASESGDGFQKRYFEALQRQPAVVLAHAEVRRTLKTRRD